MPSHLPLLLSALLRSFKIMIAVLEVTAGHNWKKTFTGASPRFLQELAIRARFDFRHQQVARRVGVWLFFPVAISFLISAGDC
jgi:hypothetical protein